MFLQQLINGFVLGSTYALVAIGYNLVLGLLNKINLAHGDIFMIGAFIGLTLVRANISLPYAFVLAVLGAAFLSFCTERLCFRPLRRAHILAPLVSTIALGHVLQNTAVQIWGSQASAFPRQYVVGSTFYLGRLTFSTVQITILLVALMLMALIDIFVHRTKVGIALRATAEAPLTASLMGVNTQLIVTLAFLLAGALAGAAGVLVFMSFGTMDPFTGVKLGLYGMVAIVIGGMGSIRGAMIGGLILGIVETLNAAYFWGAIRDIIFFGTMLIFILVRPEGIFGVRVREI
ncbi:MAG: branched-chain amino acid ABC transporter permease [Candidatus Methanomethyliaceae archaeon]